MKNSNFYFIIPVITCYCFLETESSDQFNYRETWGRDFGPEDWGQVACDEPGSCLGWPDGWELGREWELESNNCQSCPETGNSLDTKKSCEKHRQSPINLERSFGIPDSSKYKECIDWHWMKYEDSSCEWDDIRRNGFKIRRHALQIVQPVDEDGILQCPSKTGRKFPRLDYSKGFRWWWWLSHTDIKTPSEHTQEGRRYDAEIHLAHAYSKRDKHNEIGKVVIFLDGVEGQPKWPFLDKLICQFREEEDRVRDECGLSSATVPDYPGCRRADDTPIPTPAPRPPFTDPYPPVNCDYVDNFERMCKKTSCCQSEMSDTEYCMDTYEKYGDVMGSICWWCCPGKLVDPAATTQTRNPTPAPTSSSSQTTIEEPTTDPTVSPDDVVPTESSPSMVPTGSPILSPTDPPTNVPTSSPIGLPSDSPTLTPSSWPTLHPTASPALLPTNSPTPTPLPTTSPTPIPTLLLVKGGSSDDSINQGASSSPTHEPTSAPTTTTNFPVVDTTTGDGALFSCAAFPNVNFHRVCKAGGCCDPLRRSSTNFCHEAYKFFGENMNDVCSDCCTSPKRLAAAPVRHALYPPIDCTAVQNPFRICKPTSCCQSERSTTAYCKGIYDLYGDDINSICWYCCGESKEVGPVRRNLRRATPNKVSVEGEEDVVVNDGLGDLAADRDEEDLQIQSSFQWRNLRKNDNDGADSDPSGENKELSNHNPIEMPSNAKLGNIMLTEEDFRDDMTDDEFQHTMEEYQQLRQNQTDYDKLEHPGVINFEDVPYSDYAWMREVNTEYYFRYEGTQAVPPCFESVHWRVMKDPIRVHPDQIRELERLLAQRISPRGSEPKSMECKVDTAGRPMLDKNRSVEEAVDLSRPLQSFNRKHHATFCGCEDWKSKFQSDIDWCKNERDIAKRYYDTPYNFDTVGNF